MLEQIENYQKGNIKLRTMHDNLWALFEITSDLYENKKFSSLFHKYWDHIEEIIALKEEDIYRTEIDNNILPDFKKCLLSYLNDTNKKDTHVC